MASVPEKIIEQRGEVASFGGSTLVQNIHKADKAIAKMEFTEKFFDRSRSEFRLKNRVHAFSADWKNLRQISAEMQRKRDALKEAKFRYAKQVKEIEIKRAEIEIKREELFDTSSVSKDAKVRAEISLIEVEIDEIESQLQAGVPKIEGALKEILTLETMHDTLTKRIAESLGKAPEDIDENDFERCEARSHIKHAVVQAVRECRATGRIGTGVQEYLEQCGVCPATVIKDIAQYLKLEKESNPLGTEVLHNFLEQTADKYEDQAQAQTERLGFTAGHDKAIAFTRGEE